MPRHNNWPRIQTTFAPLRERFNAERWHTARPDAALVAFSDSGNFDAWKRATIDTTAPHRTEPRPWAMHGNIWGEPEEVNAFVKLAADAGAVLPLELSFVPPMFPGFNPISNMHPAPQVSWLEFLFLTCPSSFTLHEGPRGEYWRVARLDASPFVTSVQALDRVKSLDSAPFLRDFRSTAVRCNPWLTNSEREAALLAVEVVSPPQQSRGASSTNAPHWTDFPETVEKFGDLVSILETLDRHDSEDGFTAEDFQKERGRATAYTVDFHNGQPRFNPRLDRMPGLERLLDRYGVEGYSALTLAQARELRRRVMGALKRGRSAVEAMTFEEVADALDAADSGQRPASLAPPQADTPPPARVPPKVAPPREALDEACRLTLAAIRAARTLPGHRAHFNREDCTPTFRERCEDVAAQVGAARAAVATLALAFRAATRYAADRPFCGKFWASAHEAAAEAANDVLWRFRPECGDPGEGPEDRVYAALEGEVEKEHAAAVARFCAHRPEAPPPPPPQPAPLDDCGIQTFGDFLASVSSVERAAGSLRRTAEAMNDEPGTAYYRIQAAVYEADAEYKKHPSFPLIEAYVNEHYGALTHERLLRVRGKLCGILQCGTTQVDRLAIEEVVTALSRPRDATHLPPSPPAPLPMTDNPNTAYTVNDIRDLLRYRHARAAFDAQRRSMIAANPVTDISRGMNLNYWSALNCPQSGRLSEEVASTLAVYRRLLRESLAVLKKEFDEQTLLYFVGEVAERHGRSIDQMWPLTIQEFGELMDALQTPVPGEHPAVPVGVAEPPRPQPSAAETPERKLTERQKLILAEMLALGAVGSTKKTTRKEVVRRVDRSKTPQDLARDFGVLKEANYTDSEPGPEGGVWLTGGGKRRAEKLAEENER